MARLGFVISQIREIEDARQKRSEQKPETGPHNMVRRLARIVGVGVETADMLVHEVLSRPMRDRRAVARYAGLTGAPDESGAQRHEQGLARAGNARVRRGMIQLAWRFLMFQKESALALWYRARTADSRIDDDRRAGPQTDHPALALCHHWRATGGHRLTSSGLKGLPERGYNAQHHSALALAFS
jgi:transposase